MRYDPHFHLGMRVMTLIWCFRGWQVWSHVYRKLRNGLLDECHMCTENLKMGYQASVTCVQKTQKWVIRQVSHVYRKLRNGLLDKCHSHVYRKLRNGLLDPYSFQGYQTPTVFRVIGPLQLSGLLDPYSFQGSTVFVVQ